MCVEQRRGEMIFLFYYFLLRMTLTVLNQRLTLLTGIEMKYKSDFKSQFSNMKITIHGFQSCVYIIILLYSVTSLRFKYEYVGHGVCIRW